MEYSQVEQQRILIALEEGKEMPTPRLKKGLEKIMEVLNTWEPIVEGYAGFPIERELIDRKKREHDKDRNIGRVVRHGNNAFVISGKKADGRYIIVGKKGEKTAKAPEDMGLQTQKESIGIDIEILHRQMLAEAKKGKKVKRWWDDDGDGKGYEKHEVKKEGFVSKLKETGIFSDEELARLAEVDK
jgi:hypothetical protein|tara:strand:- start:1404 stop:1961 length:558 start_codon:yes stop_codon:yes gene_type:complete